jgi:Xaa-Pro aminopeptidase
MGLSFATISGGGPNGAIIHYHATPENSSIVTKDMIHLVDSGGQYLDGTTDVTRAFHFGTPTAE